MTPEQLKIKDQRARFITLVNKQRLANGKVNLLNTLKYNHLKEQKQEILKTTDELKIINALLDDFYSGKIK